MKLLRSPSRWDLSIGKWPDQVVRLVIIFGSGLIAAIALRQHFIPETFGELGHFRSIAIEINADHDPKYAGQQTCGECHESQAELKASSYHRLLSCENCHGPSAIHVAEAEAEGFPDTMPELPRSKQVCLNCHSYLRSRPTGFPQIIELMHNPAEPCIKCHDPHDPEPPEVPGACSGCHGQIARTKAISHHSALQCSTCHNAPVEHKQDPRSVAPSKPRERAFCGQCHSKDSQIDPSTLGVDIEAKQIPHIDLNDHGNNYQCWQCHYPHFPEGH